MGYINININYNESALCEEISFSEPGKQEYVEGSIITLKCPEFADSLKLRDRRMIIYSVNYTEDENGGLATTVSGFSTEYKYTRKAPASDISYLTMTYDDYAMYTQRNSNSDSLLYVSYGDDYGSEGWSMHAIVSRLGQNMGLIVCNTLPDYFISDFTISLGSTYFEALMSLVSQFDPIVSLSGNTLYILERSGVGAMGGGSIKLANISSRSVDREYTPKPGCVKVEGQEGEYIASKDQSMVCSIPVEDKIETSERVTNADGTTSNYNNKLEFWKDPYDNQWASTKRVEMCTILPKYYGNFLSKTKNTVEMEYDKRTLNFKYMNPILTQETKTCEAWVGSFYSGEMKEYNIIETTYTHDIDDWSLKSQVTTKQELLIFDGDTYTKYDPRNYDPEDDDVTLILKQTEQRSTIYTYLTEEAYSVDTQISSQVYNEDDEEWQTIYTFEHDVVLAGGQQHAGGASGVSSLRTLQVYGGSCPIAPSTHTYNEPPQVFNISTPDWSSVSSCYNALLALVDYEFQKATVRTLASYWYEEKEIVFDPLPFMGINGLGDIMESGIKGNYYVTGYNINLDPNSGYTVNLDLEARRA